MKIVYTLTILICLIFMACGEDTSCTQADWVGSYILKDSDCIDESLEFEDLIIIEEGSDANTILIDGTSVTINACDASAFGFAPLELDGDKLKIKLDGGVCEGEYEKN